MRRKQSLIRSGSRKEHSQNCRGQAQVEFALIIVFIMLLVLGSMELMSMMHTYSVLADAAKEGLRYAVVHGNNNSTPSGPSCPCADIDGPPAPPGSTPGYGSGYGVVRTYAQYSLHDLTGLTVSVSYLDTANPPANKPPNRVQVVVAYPYRPFFNLGWPTVTVNAAAEGRIMN
jgi:TadE-like protein